MPNQLEVSDPSIKIGKTFAVQPLSAKFLSQLISMGPFVFQTARCLKKMGFLSSIYQTANEGLSEAELQLKLQLSSYSVEVLVDAGVSCKLLVKEFGKVYLTEVGYFIQFDEITEVNMNFSQDVCYQGLFFLEQALKSNEAVGLKHFGDWTTIYEGLTKLPETALRSWFAFDHFYSDGAFPRVFPYVFADNPKKILDIGGNTGKFAISCAQANLAVSITLVDHPRQVEIAKENVRLADLSERITFYACDLLNENTELPKGYDAIWMSQFLDCFSEEQIIYLLKKVKASLNPGGSIFIMETFTDNQKFDSAKFCLDMTSLYFTAMANGKSRMYPMAKFVELIEKADLKVSNTFENIRLFHTILKCQL